MCTILWYIICILYCVITTSNQVSFYYHLFPFYTLPLPPPLFPSGYHHVIAMSMRWCCCYCFCLFFSHFFYPAPPTKQSYSKPSHKEAVGKPLFLTGCLLESNLLLDKLLHRYWKSLLMWQLTSTRVVMERGVNGVGWRERWREKRVETWRTFKMKAWKTQSDSTPKNGTPSLCQMLCGWGY